MMNLGAFVVISLLAACLSLLLLSMIGILLIAGFIAKFYLFSAGIPSGWTLIIVVAVLNSAVSAYYYLQVVIYMYVRPPPGAHRTGRTGNSVAWYFTRLVVEPCLSKHPGIKITIHQLHSTHPCRAVMVIYRPNHCG